MVAKRHRNTDSSREARAKRGQSGASKGAKAQKLTKKKARQIVAQALREATEQVRRAGNCDVRRFLSFRKHVREDLICLTMLGLNPGIVVYPILIPLWLWSAYSKEMKARDDEVRMLGSSRYWAKAVKSLKNANRFFSELREMQHFQKYQSGGHIPPPETSLLRFFYHVDRAAPHLDAMLTIIECRELDRHGWTGALIREMGNPPPPRKGRGKSGAPHQYDWAECALNMSDYFTEMLGSPHWSTVARLLHFADFEDFPSEILPTGYSLPLGPDVESNDGEYGMAYVDRIRRRVETLKKERNRQ